MENEWEEDEEETALEQRAQDVGKGDEERVCAISSIQIRSKKSLRKSAP